MDGSTCGQPRQWKPSQFRRNPSGNRTSNSSSRRSVSESATTGCDSWSDLFTPRQLVALTTFSDLVQEARERVQRDALAAGLPDDGKPLRDGGIGATAYAEAVVVYLGACVDKHDRHEYQSL